MRNLECGLRKEKKRTEKHECGRRNAEFGREKEDRDAGIRKAECGRRKEKKRTEDGKQMEQAEQELYGI